MLSLLLLSLICNVFASQSTNNFELPEQQWAESETPEVRHHLLPGLALSDIHTSFSCVGRGYGYFADVSNNCQIYHICYPTVSANRRPVIHHYVRLCPNQSQFDQRVLSCLSATNYELLPCQQSIQYYSQTELRFSKTQFEGQQTESVEQIPVQDIERRPLVEQRFEQIPVEEQRSEVVYINTPLNEDQPVVRSETIINRNIPTKSVIRSESVEVVPQPVLSPVVVSQTQFSQPIQPQQSVPLEPVVQQSVLVEPVVPLRSGQTVEALSQAIPSQPQSQVIPSQPQSQVIPSQPQSQVIPSQPQSPLRRAIVLQRLPQSVVSQLDSVERIVSQPVVRNVEPIRAEIPVLERREVLPTPTQVEVANTESVQPVSPLRSVKSAQTQTQSDLVSQPFVQESGLARPVVALRNVDSIHTEPQVPSLGSLVQQSAVVRPAVFLRGSPFVRSRPQTVVTIGRSEELPTLSHSITPLVGGQVVRNSDVILNLNSASVVNQPFVPLRSRGNTENRVELNPLLSGYNVPYSQLYSVQSPQVVPQVIRTQPLISSGFSWVGVQPLAQQRVVSQNGLPLNAGQVVPEAGFNSRFANIPNVNVVRPPQNPLNVN